MNRYSRQIIGPGLEAANAGLPSRMVDASSLNRRFRKA
jgi:hypothetical protein